MNRKLRVPLLSALVVDMDEYKVNAKFGIEKIQLSDEHVITTVRWELLNGFSHLSLKLCVTRDVIVEISGNDVSSRCGAMVAHRLPMVVLGGGCGFDPHQRYIVTFFSLPGRRSHILVFLITISHKCLFWAR
jgi:hypothetical protein